MKISELLKQARIEKGLTLDDVARDLYIQDKYLEALENGHFEVIPGEAYQRAYFKKYADYLGIADYINNLTRPHGSMQDQKKFNDNEIFGGEWDNARWTRVGIKLALIILIPTLIVLGVRAKNNPDAEVPDETLRVDSTQPINVVPVDTDRSWQFPGEEGYSDPLGVIEDSAHQLRLTATGQCWVKLETRDSVLINGEILVAGDQRTFTDVIGFNLTAGAPEKLQVELDGEFVPWPQGVTQMTLPEGAAVIPVPEVTPEDTPPVEF